MRLYEAGRTNATVGVANGNGHAHLDIQSPQGAGDPALTEALAACRRGWPVFPLHAVENGRCSCRKAECPHPGKHPRIVDNLNQATTDEKKVLQWASKWPGSNWGVVTGKRSGVVVLDEDPRHGGDRSLIARQRDDGPLPTTPTVRTGGDGLHYFFLCPDRAVRCTNDPKVLGEGLDRKADGGYVVLAGSLHASGRRYEWINNPGDTDLAQAPLWVLSEGPAKNRSECGGTERTESTERTERDREDRVDGGGFSVLSVFSGVSDISGVSGLSVPDLLDSEEVQIAIGRSVPDAPGRRHRMVFNLARELKAIKPLADLPASELRLIVKRWHDVARPFIDTKPFEDSWADFISAWPRVKYARGDGPLEEALARADALANPPEVSQLGYEDPRTIRLLKLCRELQHIAGSDPFFLTVRDAGRLVGMDKNAANKRFQAFLEDGLLVLVAPHGPMKAARYRYTGRMDYDAKE